MYPIFGQIEKNLFELCEREYSGGALDTLPIPTNLVQDLTNKVYMCLWMPCNNIDKTSPSYSDLSL